MAAGPVATALATAGKYGSRTVMIDRIGDDMVGRYILEDFHKYNVNNRGQSKLMWMLRVELQRFL